MQDSRPRGFTLLELMVSMAIIGILASVAIPSFRSFHLRAKAAERPLILTSIYRAIDDLYMRDMKFPLDFGAGTSELYLFYDQPDFSPTTTKRAWRRTALNALDHWNNLAMQVDGAVYYRYGGYAYVTGASRYYYLYAYGDLDGDNVRNQWTKEWVWFNGRQQRYAGSTLNCPECSIAWEDHPETW